MSYILDALKKIEHEKSKKLRPGGKASISGDLFQERSRPPARAGIWKIVLLIVAVSLVTGAATWFVLKGSGKKTAVAVLPAAPAPPAPPPVVVNPPVVPPVPLPAQPQPAPAVAPSATPAASTNTEPDDGEEDSAREARRSKKQIKAPLSATYPKQLVQTVQPPADIKLSGIAWQDERAARRAVINGFLLKEGAVVSGAKITDIQADRVRFLSTVGRFEIKLDAVLPPEVKQ